MTLLNGDEFDSLLLRALQIDTPEFDAALEKAKRRIRAHEFRN